MEQAIQNFEALAENDLRCDALAVAEAGYEAININTGIRDKVQVVSDGIKIDGKTYSISGRRVFFLGIGKCAFAAAQTIEEILGDSLTGGIALDVTSWTPGAHSNCGRLASTSKIERFVGTHPLPSEANVQATERILKLLSECKEEDLVIALISGGGSTLLCAPNAPMTPNDEVLLFQKLTAHGATIQELNTVRKHLSRARGGGLARAAYPAEVISLIVSDVPGDDIAFISSGPTVRDESTVSDAQAVLAKYNITPPTNTTFIETEKDTKYFERINNILFLSGKDALSAMQQEAVRRGYKTEIVDTQFAGEAREIGKTIVEKLHASPSKTALLYAGESTVTLTDTRCQSISGGRNQEMALAALESIQSDELILPFASDGHDNTDHAGAIADAVTQEHAHEKNLSIDEFLSAHNSYDFFSTTGDALLTGYTGSNIADLIIALKK